MAAFFGKFFGPIDFNSVQLRSKTVHFRVEFEQASRVKPIDPSRFLERAMGIEPTSEAWEASNKNLKALELAALSESDGLLK